ncbi:MAG: hypothetical protein H9W81_09810 [Enterococcus sp.]|nr:hypothetical protein [Enterococcus sp.]
MNLVEIPKVFPSAAQKVAERSPKAINAQSMTALGRKSANSVSRAFYVASLGQSYRSAGFMMMVLTALTALIFREHSPGIIIFLFWGLSVGFMLTSLMLDYRLMKFHLLFTEKPTEQQLLEALRKTPSNWTWIIVTLMTGGVPYFFLEILPHL